VLTSVGRPRHTGAIAVAVIPFIPGSGPIGSWPCIGRATTAARIVAAVGGSPGTAQHGLVKAGAALVRGPLGSGKTRLVDEVVAMLAVKGRIIRRIVATSATSAVPFGAVAHLLPVGARDSADPLMLIASLRDVLAADGDERPVLVIDDAPLLDVATAGVIATLAGAGAVHVVASARDEEPLPDPLVDVLLGDGACAVALTPLSEDDMDTLLHLVLGGPVDGSVLMSMRDRSEGNPLFLRELTRSALDSGALVEVGGVWLLRGAAPSSTRLREVVESRLDVVAPLARPALELLALCDVADLDELEAMVGLEALVDFEARGLLRIVHRGIRQFATLGHPLHGEAIRMSLPAMRSRLLLRDHVLWIEANDLAEGHDALQLTLWRLDAGLPTDLDSLMHGARLAAAMHDSRSVLRLARPLFAQRPTAAGGGMLAVALFQTGQWAEALAVLDRSSSLSAPPQLRVDLASARANILLWGVGDSAAALAALEDLRSDPAMGDGNLARLSAQIASVLVHAGRPGDARLELEEAASSDQLQLMLGAAVSYANSLAMGGRTSDAIATIDRALGWRPESGLSGVADVDAHHVAKAFSMIEAGRLAEAIELATEQYAAAVAIARPLSQFWFMLILGRAHLCTGRAATSLRYLTNARALGLESGLAGPARSAVIGVTISHSVLGSSAAADSALAEIDSLPPFGFMGPEKELAVAWAAVARGDLALARAVLVRGAELAADSGHITSAIWMLHDVGRLGRPADVVDRLAYLVAITDSPLAHARLDHVRAMTAADLHALSSVADKFEAIGANLLAAEAAVAAADVARDRGDQRAAVAFMVRAERYAALCEGASTPALAVATRSVDPLTEREREIAFLAASELTSREIAEQLFLSFRTVNNHLQHIYDKLGIRGRSELRGSLGLAQE